MLFTKCILCAPSPSDGIRISVMSRHTHNDGITVDKRLIGFDIHAPILGPSPRLIGDYYKRGLSWEEFCVRYQQEIRTDRKASVVHILAYAALKRNITILCIEEGASLCHRSLLANECKRIFPELQIVHR